VSRLRKGPARPFDRHLAAFHDIFAARRATDPPPRVWRPTAAQARGSNLGRLMRRVGRRDYAELHAWSVAHRTEFWATAIERLGIVFARPPETILDLAGGVEAARWLPGTRLNITDSCFQAPTGRPAIVHADETDATVRTMSYGELGALVGRVAGGLRARGLRAGDGVALYMPMTPECVAAYLGAVRAGCRVVSIADSFSPEELARRCGLGDARTVVTAEATRRSGKTLDLYGKVKQAGVGAAFVLPLDRAARRGAAALRPGDLWWSDLLSGGGATASQPADPDDVINVLFSSGTTGDPKAIPWTHLTPIKCAMDGHFHQDIRPDDVVAWPTNIGWMMGPWLIYATLINRACMALFDGSPLDAGFVRFVRAAGVSILGVVPSMVRAWRGAGRVGARDWRRVRLFSSTGEPSGREDYLWLMSRTGYRAPVIEYLGGTEIGGGHITGTVAQPASPATFTTPALGLDFVVLDEGGRPVGEGETGELYLIPPSIGLSQRLLHHDHHTVYYEDCPRGPAGATLRRHGDLMTRLPGGFFKAQGRSDDTMNLGGIKVSALELERILETHPGVYECAAVAVQPQGEGAEMLVVFVVPQQGAAPPPIAELNRLIAARLNPLFKIADLIVVDGLPRTASNKLMRRTLRAGYRA
jgi:acetyl-CoA synthetase